MLDTAPLRAACHALLDAAELVLTPRPPSLRRAASGAPIRSWRTSPSSTPPTIATAHAIAAGTNTTYDNRIALDTWTINQVIALAGGNTGLRERIRHQADVLCALGEPVLSETELDTPVPTRLLSNDTLRLDQPVPLRDLIAGLADTELPGHTQQLQALLPNHAEATA